MSNKKLAISGAKWTSISTFINASMQFGQVAVLARLLEPSSFGLVSISMMVITFLGIFAHFGFSNSIVFKQEGDRKILSTIYYLNLIIGAIMFLVIYFGSPLLVWYYKEPRLEEVLRLAAFYFPIVFLGQIYNILIEKELRFRDLALTDIFSTTLGTSLTIFLAYRGLEAKSLIYGLLLTQASKMLIQNYLGRIYFSPIRYFRLSQIKDHLKFGIYNIGDSLLSFANGNIDTILIGGLLGVKELGYYTIAYQIAIYPVVRICPIIIQICYPIMARMKQDKDKLKNAYLKIVDFISYCNMPLLIGLYFMAGSVVPLIYGKGWETTIPLIQIFVFIGIFSSMIYPLSTLAYCTGKPNLLFYYNLVAFIVKIPVVYFAAKYYGTIGISVGVLGSTILFLLVNFSLVNYMIGKFLPQFLENIAKPMLFCILMSVSILIYRNVVGDDSLLHTILQIVIGGAVYIFLTLKYKLSFSEIKSLKSSL